MPWAYPYTAFYNWNLTGITVVIATVISIFSVKANVPPFLPQPLSSGSFFWDFPGRHFQIQKKKIRCINHEDDGHCGDVLLIPLS